MNRRPRMWLDKDRGGRNEYRPPAAAMTEARLVTHTPKVDARLIECACGDWHPFSFYEAAAAPAEGLRLAPSVYAQGHGLPDHCAEHGDIPGDQSMVSHVRQAHGLTYEQWQTLEEADRIRGIEPFDPHASHEHAALARHEAGSE